MKNKGKIKHMLILAILMTVAVYGIMNMLTEAQLILRLDFQFVLPSGYSFHPTLFVTMTFPNGTQRTFIVPRVHGTTFYVPINTVVSIPHPSNCGTCCEWYKWVIIEWATNYYKETTSYNPSLTWRITWNTVIVGYYTMVC